MRGLAADAARASARSSPSSRPIRRRCRSTRSPRRSQFLEWLVADNFTFLGVREYALTADERRLEPIRRRPGSASCATPDVQVLRRGSELVTMTPEIMEFLHEPKPLIITKANVRSRVHRRVHMDYVGVKRFDATGSSIGEFRIVGLFTSTAYTRSTRSIPYLRRKVDSVIAPRRLRSRQPFRQGAGQRAGELSARRAVPDRRGHALPASRSTILQLDERPRVRVLARRDRFDRFVSVLVYRAARPLRQRGRARRSATIWRASTRAASRPFYPFFPEGPLVRVHFIIGRDERRDARSRPRDARAGGRRASCAPGPTGSREALALVHEPVKAQALARALSRRLPGRLSRGLFAAEPRSPTSA